MFRQVTFCALLVLVVLVPSVFADPVLNDWCVNVNGDTASLCNGAGSSLSGVDASGFDKTLSPSANTLGSISVTLTAAGYASVYMDYDLDFATFGSFQDSGATHGALPAGVSYELDDPNTSNIFSDFATSSLLNTNNVGTASGPLTPCCDVSWALGVQTTEAGTLKFTVSTVQPAGFYLQQTNFDVGDSIYLSESFTPNGGGTTGGTTGGTVPEPSSWGLLGTSVVVLALNGLRKRCSKSA